jgi:hypothetical protein
MAESNPIKDTDLIQDKVFQPTIDQANELLAVVKSLTQGFREMSASANKTLISTKPDSIANLNKINGAINDIEKSSKSLSDLEKKELLLKEKLAQLQTKQAIESQKLTEQIREQQKANKQAARDQLGLTTAYQKASRTLNELRNAYKNLELAGRSQGKVGRALLQTVQEQDAKLKALDASTGQHYRNVGNYGIAITKLGKGIKALTSLLGELGNAFGFNTEVVERFVGIGTAINKTLKEIHHAQGLSKVAAQANTAAIEAQTAATELNSAATEANTIAIETTAAATVENAVASEALAVAEEAQAAASEAAAVAQAELNAVQKASPLGVVIAVVTAAALAIGFYISKIFENKKAEQERWKAIDGTIIKDKALRKEHNDSIYTLQKLTVEYRLITGAINEYQAAIASLRIEYRKTLTDISEETRDKTEEISGFWHTAKNSFSLDFTEIEKSVFEGNSVMSSVTKQGTEEIFQIQKDAFRRIEDARKEHDQKVEIEHRRHLKQLADDELKANQDIERQIQAIEAATIKDEHERNLQQIYLNTKAALADVSNSKASALEKAKATEAIWKKYHFDVEQENKAFYKTAAEKLLHHLELQSRLLEGARRQELAENEIAFKREKKQAEENGDDINLVVEYYNRVREKINRKYDDIAADRRIAAHKAEKEELQQHYKDLQAVADRARETSFDITHSEEEKRRAAIKKQEADRIGDIDALKKAGVISEQQYQEKIHEIIADAARQNAEIDADIEEDAKKRREKQIDELASYIETIFDSIQKAMDRIFDRQRAALEEDGRNIEDELSRQEQRFRDGLDNNLAYQRRAQAENDVEQAQLAERRRRAEERRKLAELFLSFAEGYAKDGDLNANSKALTQALIAQGIAKAIAGSAFEGTEDTGGPGDVDGRGGRLWVLHPNERVVPKALNEKVAGMSNDELVHRAIAFDTIYRPQFAGALPREAAIDQPAESNWMASAVLNGLAKVEKAVSGIETTTLTATDLGEIMETVTKNGLKRQITHKRPSF